LLTRARELRAALLQRFLLALMLELVMEEALQLGILPPPLRLAPHHPFRLLAVVVRCHTIRAARQTGASQPVLHLVPPLRLLSLNNMRSPTVAPVLESLAIHVCRACACIVQE
jgi:hypothetical protein